MFLRVFSTTLLVVFTLWLLIGTATANQGAEGHHSDVRENDGAGEGSQHGGEHGHHRYHVAKFDFQYVKIYFIVGIWVLYAGAAKIFFHRCTFLSKIFPESCMLIVIGVLLGLALLYDNQPDYTLNTTTFFLVLLPPIILDAGYYMPARPFFDQLGTILLYAVLGTLVNTLWLGFSLWGVYEGGGFSSLSSPLLLLHALVLASLLAAVDPVAVIAVFEALHVNEILYIVVFGESLLNDGISVVLYHVFEGFSEIGIENIQGIDIFAGFASFFVIVFGATGIGILLGLFGGFLSRFTHHTRNMEPLVVFVIGYLSFLIAEMFHLSGILSCTFCGITMRKYVEANIAPKSKTTIKYLLKMAATCCEIIIFMYIGISPVSDTHHWDTAFCILTLVFCLIYRALGMLPIVITVSAGLPWYPAMRLRPIAIQAHFITSLANNISLSWSHLLVRRVVSAAISLAAYDDDLGVIILTYLANLIRVVKLTKIDQFIMAYGGLRGAIAFALVVLLDKDLFPHRKMFITSTVLVIYFTNLAMGTTIKPLVQFLKIKRADKSKPSMSEKFAHRYIDHLMAGVEDIADQQGHHLLRERFSYLNNRFFKPIIVGKKNPQRRGWQVWSVYSRLNQKSAQQIIRSAASSGSLAMLLNSSFETDLMSSSHQFVGSPSTMNQSSALHSRGVPNGSHAFSGEQKHQGVLLNVGDLELGLVGDVKMTESRYYNVKPTQSSTNDGKTHHSNTSLKHHSKDLDDDARGSVKSSDESITVAGTLDSTTAAERSQPWKSEPNNATATPPTTQRPLHLDAIHTGFENAAFDDDIVDTNVSTE